MDGREGRREGGKREKNEHHLVGMRKLFSSLTSSVEDPVDDFRERENGGVSSCHDRDLFERRDSTNQIRFESEEREEEDEGEQTYGSDEDEERLENEDVLSAEGDETRRDTREREREREREIKVSDQLERGLHRCSETKWMLEHLQEIESQVDEDEILRQLSENREHVLCRPLSPPRHRMVGVVLESDPTEEERNDTCRRSKQGRAKESQLRSFPFELSHLPSPPLPLLLLPSALSAQTSDSPLICNPVLIK